MHRPFVILEMGGKQILRSGQDNVLRTRLGVCLSQVMPLSTEIWES